MCCREWSKRDNELGTNKNMRVQSKRMAEEIVQLRIETPAPRVSWGRYLVWGAGTVVALLITWNMWRALELWARRRDTAHRCANAHGEILVLIHSYADRSRAIITAREALRRAFCPSRVRICISDEIVDPSEPAFRDSVAHLVHRHELGQATNQIRSITLDRADRTTMGPVYAYRQLVNRLSTDQSWVLTLQPGDSLVTNWDRLLLMQWQQVRGPKSRSRYRVLSWTPSTSAGTGSVLRDLPSDPSISRWMAALTTSSAQQLEKNRLSAEPGFSVLEDTRGYVPLFGRRRFPEAPRQPVRVLGGTRFFARRALFERALESPVVDVPCAGYAAPWVLSACLHAVGGEFWSLTHPTVIAAEQATRCVPADWKGRTLNKAMLRHLSGMQNFAAFDMGDGTLYGRARLGVVDETDERETGAKYGTQADFDRAKRQL